MNSPDRLPKHLLIGFGLALLIYAVFFTCDQRMRQRKGPWQVAFMTNTPGWATIQVKQSSLNIDTTITFVNEAVATNGLVVFDKPGKQVPFGRVKFEDLTYLPGSVAFDFFGHEVELLPRTLYLNKREHSWAEKSVFELRPDEKMPPEMHHDPRKKKRR